MNRNLPKRLPILERRRAKKAPLLAEQEREQRLRQLREHELAAKGHLPVNRENLAPDGSYGTPEFVERGYYIDLSFNCKSCGVAQVWKESQQKWWYESAKGNVWTVAVLCKTCRRREQARRAAARKAHLDGLAKKRVHEV